MRAPRPRAVPSLATETPTSITVDPPQDPIAARAIASLQRTVDVLQAPAKQAAGHPTLRDQLLEVTLATGRNTFDHGLGRPPRFVYVDLLESGPSWVCWRWDRRAADVDRAQIQIVVTSDSGAADVSLPAIVRIE